MYIVDSNSTTQQYGLGSNYGYVCGGYYIGSYFSTIDRFQFPFNSGIANKVSNLSRSRYNSSANNSSTHGYVCGGVSVSKTLVFWTSSSWAFTIDRFQFPFDDGIADHVGNLGRRRNCSGANNSSTHGYICGGHNGCHSLFSIERFQFPFDSGTASQVGNLSSDRDALSANNSSTHGYVCGGYGNGYYFRTIDRFQFPFDSGTANHVGNLSRSRDHLCANNSSIYGYAYGGYGSKGSGCAIDRFQFSFDSSTASQVGDLSVSRGDLSANNSSTYGYVCGGYYGDENRSFWYSTIDRIQFPFDGGTSNYTGNLSRRGRGMSATDGVDFVTMLL